MRRARVCGGAPRVFPPGLAAERPRAAGGLPRASRGGPGAAAGLLGPAPEGQTWSGARSTHGKAISSA